MPAALITVINGFSGRYVAAELRSAGYEVCGLGLAAPGAGADGFVRCDLCDRRAVAEMFGRIHPDVVVHLAAIAFAAHGDVEEVYRTNVVGTRNLLEAVAAQARAPSAVLLASSANVYGNAKAAAIDETTPPQPTSDYGVSKLAMEHLSRLWADSLPITIVRPFNYTGVGQSGQFLLPKIVSHFRSRAAFIELGNLDVVRDFSDVRFVAQCYRRLVEFTSRGTARGEVFNTCSGRGHSLQEVLDIMRGISGHAMEVRVNPAFVRSNEIARLVGSRAKLERAVGAVDDIPLAQTLSWMYHDAGKEGS